MAISMHLPLKRKILIGLILIGFLSVGISVYCASKFSYLEARIAIVNSAYVPILKTLNQIEGYLYSYEQDLDRALLDTSFVKPKSTQLQLMEAKINLLVNSSVELVESNKNTVIALKDLQLIFNEMNSNIDLIFNHTSKQPEYDMLLSKARGDFRHQLRILIRDVDREIRLASVDMQRVINKSGIILTFLFVISLMIFLLLGYWAQSTLRPLDQLTHKVRDIAEQGLTQQQLEELLKIKYNAHNEVSIFIKEFSKMASHLLDQTKQLEIQKENLEKAHLEMARQNVDLRKTKNQLLHKEKLALIGQLSAQMAHEIRNPLNALSLHMELMEQEIKTKKDITPAIYAIKNEIERLSEITESYLKHARVPQENKEDVDLNALIESTVQLYDPILKEKKVICTYQLDKIPLIQVDKRQLSQIFSNLIKNSYESLEACKENEKKYIRIFSGYNSKKKEIEVCFTDNGAGIRDEDKNKIFSPFFTTKADGTGLGLAHTKQIIDVYSGDIRFDSVFGKGTSFRITIPVSEKYNREAEQYKEAFI